MAHELEPRSGELPPNDEIVRRLSAKFAYVRVDADAGLRRARAAADSIERRSPTIHRESFAAFVRRLRALLHGDALLIEIGDEPSRALQFLLLPGERIRFGYGSVADELASRSLVDRCADALDCDVHVV